MISAVMLFLRCSAFSLVIRMHKIPIFGAYTWFGDLFNL